MTAIKACKKELQRIREAQDECLGEYYQEEEVQEIIDEEEEAE